MNRLVFILIIGLFPLILQAQNPNGNYNPYVEEGMVSPAPLLPFEDGGSGTFSFLIGNDGDDPLEVFSDQHLILTITLSYGVPEGEDPLHAVDGSYAGYFTWEYNSLTRTYSASQVTEIPARSAGNIEIVFEVERNSSAPGTNGFNVNITPSPYQTTSNDQGDDAVSSYTYTESSTGIGEFEDTFFSIYPNPSEGEFVIDLKDVSGIFSMEIIASNGTILKKDVVNLKGEAITIYLDDFVPGLCLVKLYNSEQSYQQELILK